MNSDPRIPAETQPDEAVEPGPIDVEDGDAAAEDIEETGEPFDGNFA